MQHAASSTMRQHARSDQQVEQPIVVAVPHRRATGNGKRLCLRCRVRRRRLVRSERAPRTALVSAKGSALVSVKAAATALVSAKAVATALASAKAAATALVSGQAFANASASQEPWPVGRAALASGARPCH